MTYKIKDVLSIGNGRDYKHLSNGEIPVFGTGGYMTSVDECLYDGETTFIGRKGSINKPFYYNGKFWTVDTLFYTHSFNGITPKFTYCLFQTINWLKYNEASGVPSLSKDTIEKIKIKIPGLEEQNKIAKLMFALDERITTQNKIIDKLQSLIKGISSRIFTSIQGIEYRMGDIVTITNGNSNVQDAVIQSKDGLYPFFDRSEDIKYLPTFLFDKEAIIYPGEGTEFMPRYFKGKFALHQRCYAIFDFNEIINARFLYFYLKTRNSYFVKNAVGSTVPSLRLDTFQKLKVIIPPKKIQHSVSLCLSSMEQKCNVEKKILHKLLKQKQYLLRQMFI
uniref:restriction endonuclease subunit S n=1 Tax=Segatella hominis TaxID=2518605 RepID=UPI00402830A6